MFGIGAPGIGTGRIRAWSNSAEQRSAKNRFKSGDILYGKLRPYLKKYHFAQFEGICSTEIWVINSKDESVANEYLFYLVQTEKFNNAANVSSGTRMPRADWSYLKNVEFDVPPLREQNKISRILSLWDTALNLKEELIEKKHDQKKALMQKLLTGETRLPGFDEKWEEVRLGDLGELYQPQTISQRQLKNAGYPVFGANGLIGYYDMYNHENWQTLITCRGSTCGTVNRSLPKSWITGNAMVFNVDESNHVDKEFAYYLCLNQDFSRIISGSGQPQITRAPLVNYRVTIPTNKEEQIRIREIIATIDKEMQLLTKELELVKRQKKGLMQLLLTGIVRVKEVVL
ncbi:MAG TPA: restriction endonuclease subunit S [Firmicutes bacterium]|nr:restriction endonuclease subunit S [Bacillota bacterium]